MATTSHRPAGREALLDAAAVLMDEQGIDHVSLNEINRASGNRNRSAVSYHFGSRDAIVHELVARGMAQIDGERRATLDHLEQIGTDITPRMGIELAVGPLARRLDTLEGRRYLRLVGQLANHPRYVADTRDMVYVNDGLVRCAVYVQPLLVHLPARIQAERVRQAVGFVVRAIADQASLVDAKMPPRPPLAADEFTTNLVDLMQGMLTGPTSLAD